MAENRPAEAAASETPADAPAGAAAAVGPARCPLGYGGEADAPLMGPFGCLVCRGILHDASRASLCSHVFCGGCLSRFELCPLCGDAVGTPTRDAALQAEADAFLDSPASARLDAPRLLPGSGGDGPYDVRWAIDGTAGIDLAERFADARAAAATPPAAVACSCGDAPRPPASCRAVARLRLQLSLRARRAGNIPASACRAAESLCWQLAAIGGVVVCRVHPPTPAALAAAAAAAGGAASDVGAMAEGGVIAGAVGDAAVAACDTPSARCYYGASVALLTAARGRGGDTRGVRGVRGDHGVTPIHPGLRSTAGRALGVSLARLGDVMLGDGDWDAARGLYHACAELRASAALREGAPPDLLPPGTTPDDGDDHGDCGDDDGDGVGAALVDYAIAVAKTADADEGGGDTTAATAGRLAALALVRVAGRLGGETAAWGARRAAVEGAIAAALGRGGA